MTRILIAIAAVVATAALPTGAEMIQTLTLDGIKGPSRLVPDGVDLLTYSVAVNATPSYHGGGGDAKPTFSDFQFSSEPGPASPEIFGALVTGRHFKTIQLWVFDTQVNLKAPVATWKLGDAFLTSFRQESQGGEIVDLFSASFRTLDYQYTITDKNGTGKGSSKTKWDIENNKIETSALNATVEDVYLELYPIPEPATAALLSLGGLAMLRRRRGG